LGGVICPNVVSRVDEGKAFHLDGDDALGGRGVLDFERERIASRGRHVRHHRQRQRP